MIRNHCAYFMSFKYASTQLLRLNVRLRKHG